MGLSPIEGSNPSLSATSISPAPAPLGGRGLPGGADGATGAGFGYASCFRSEKSVGFSERWSSGRRRALGKRVYRKVPWVRIPLSPPSSLRRRRRRRRDPGRPPKTPRSRGVLGEGPGEAEPETARYGLGRRLSFGTLRHARHGAVPAHAPSRMSRSAALAPPKRIDIRERRCAFRELGPVGWSLQRGPIGSWKHSGINLG